VIPKDFIHPRVVRRFVILTAVATFAMFSLWAVLTNYTQAPRGDFEVRQGDILLGDEKFDAAIERFDAALKATPNHRGALMGRALAYLQSRRYPEAEAEFTRLINSLRDSLAADDGTGHAAFAAAYANRGILYDRTGRYQKALSDYMQALKIDPGAVAGPGFVDKIIYGVSKPSTVRDRAIYLQQQLALPPEKRLLTLPAEDAKQRMHKPY
jgi:tetratricopeptide (TPR) repeat protein